MRRGLKQGQREASIGHGCLLDFTGKAALITHGSIGFGRATALAFARQGPKILIGDLSDMS